MLLPAVDAFSSRGSNHQQNRPDSLEVDRRWRIVSTAIVLADPQISVVYQSPVQCGMERRVGPRRFVG